MAHPQLAPEQQSRVEHVVGAVAQCEKTSHLNFRQRYERLYARYRGYRAFLKEFSSTAPRDRDTWIRDQDSGFGPPLTIPYAFATVETVLPRMLSNRPRMLVMPRGEASERNVQNVKYMIDSQQEKIQYELVLQDIGKDGLIGGLGVQKTLWRRDQRRRKMLARGFAHPLIEVEKDFIEFDGPVAERVDPIDFFGDTYASEITAPAGRVMEWAVHRTWRSDRYVLARMSQGLWNPLDEADVKSLGSKQRFDEVNTARQAASGLGSDTQSWGGIHEVLEFHDGERLITVLDREWLLIDMPNPYWHGEIPFQLYRPTKVPGQLYGIGEIEPIEDLCAEMDELRTNRRDNQRIAIQQVFAYDEGSIDSADLKFGPGMAIPTQGDPRALLFPIPTKPLDGAGYQEEQALVQNIDRTSGLSDFISGAESQVQQTATGAQLIQAAAGVRIQNKTHRLEVETIAPGARHFCLLDQQMIRSSVEIRLPAPPSIENPEARWQWFQVDPLGLQGEFEFQCEGGATAPENVPQKRADAQSKQALLQDPMIDRRKVLVSVLEDLGFKQGEQYLAPPQPSIDPRVLEAIKATGQVDPNLVDRVAGYVQGALQPA